MSLQPEFIIQSVIVKGITAFRRDTRFIDQLFRNLDQVSLEQVRSFVRDQGFDININYPRDTPKLPAIIILLKSENESNAYLGDSQGIGLPDEFSYDGDVANEILGGTASISNISGIGTIVFGPYRAAGGTANTLTITTREWNNSEFVGRNLTLRLVAGTGAGQIRDIVANGVTSIMISPNWSTIPDTTTIFEIRNPSSELLGEPAKLYDRRNQALFVEKRGSLYNDNYQVHILGENPEQTVYLTTIIKAIFTVMRLYMENQGIINLKLSATDFINKPEYQPDFAYTRALNLEFLHSFDIFEDLGPLATELSIAIENCQDNSQVINTSISLTNVTVIPGP